MKKKICLLLVAVVACFFCACGGGEQPKGEPTFTANHTKDGYSASAVMDGNTEIGWVGGKKATESNFQVFNIDFGEQRTFSKITLDDSFADGYTNRPPEYIKKTVVYGEGNASSVGSGSTLVNVLSGGADGLSWTSEEIPSKENAQWIWISLSEQAEIKKIVLNNEMNNSVPVSYELYYSENAHNRRKPEKYTDVSTYTLMQKKTDNEENVVEIESEEAIVVRDVFLKIYSQQNEGTEVIASLDEILFYGETPADYHEEHQPEKFTLMGSTDGKMFEVIVEVAGNYDAVWTYRSEKKLSYRYIRYIVFAEYNNNYPSIGEMTFE